MWRGGGGGGGGGRLSFSPGLSSGDESDDVESELSDELLCRCFRLLFFLAIFTGLLLRDLEHEDEEGLRL